MNPTPAALALLADPAYRRLKEQIIQATGLAYYADKDADLAVRLAQRLAQTGVRDGTAYLTLLAEGEKGEAELDALIEDLTIGETFFFRHRELFDALRDVIFPDLIARNQHRRQLRIWSAGCSTGAEAYSLSILLRRELAPRVAGWDVTIVGTDINRDFLARARAGRFEEWAFRTTPAELKRDCFEPAEKNWVIKPEFKEGVSFEYHNLVTHPFPSLLNNLFAFDLILCRNVTIYFSLEIIRGILGHFYESLVEGGWLLVGHAEPNLELFRAFQTVNAPGAVLYKKGPPQRQQGGARQEDNANVSPAPPASLFPSSAQGGWSSWTPPILPWEPPTAGIQSAKTPPAATASTPAPPRPLAPHPALPVLATIRSHADRGAWDQALACCEKLLAQDKLNPVVYFYQALVLEQMQRHTEAENALRRAIYLDRNFILAHYYLGLLLEKQGFLQPAARSFKNVQQLLSRVSPDEVFAHGDGITATELNKMTLMHLEILERA